MRFLVTLLATLAVVPVAAQGIAPLSPAHLTVSTSIATSTVHRGKPVGLLVDVTPKPKIHVYAPGAENYQPIKLTIEPQPGLTVQQLHYPKSTLLVTEFEKVPVYDKPFRLAQDVTIDPAGRGGSLTVKGKLEYQACDDEVCYKPATIPVSWTVTVK